MVEKAKVLTGEEEDRSDSESSEVFEVVETDQSGKPVQLGKSEDEGDEDERLTSEDEGADEGQPDSGKPVRRRETHAERRERHRKARERDERERNFLRREVQRLGQKTELLESVVGRNRVEGLDERLNEELQRAEQAERIEAAAIKANNGEDAVKARRIREEALAKARQLYDEKQQLSRTAPNNQPVPNLPPYAGHVKQFVEDKPWFSFNSADPDNAVVMALDNQVASEGYDPMSPEYWAELDRRVKERLPHKFGSVDDSRQDDADDDEPPQRRTTRKGPPVGAGRTHVPETTRTQVYISPERKQAMIDAGVWDDPQLRQRYVKRYAEWDRDNKPTARR